MWCHFSDRLSFKRATMRKKGLKEWHQMSNPLTTDKQQLWQYLKAVLCWNLADSFRHKLSEVRSYEFFITHHITANSLGSIQRRQMGQIHLHNLYSWQIGIQQDCIERPRGKTNARIGGRKSTITVLRFSNTWSGLRLNNERFTNCGRFRPFIYFQSFQSSISNNRNQLNDSTLSYVLILFVSQAVGKRCEMTNNVARKNKQRLNDHTEQWETIGALSLLLASRLLAFNIPMLDFRDTWW